VTQSLGGTSHERTISPRYSIFRPDWSQDVVLLTSDGLTDTVDESTIADIIDQSKNPVFAVEELLPSCAQHWRPG
jgi:serine/threonine protein phosphatase PrpC